MSVTYRAIGWTRQKRIYDAIIAACVTLYLSLFVGLGAIVHRNATPETLLIRAFGTAALLLLHVVLSIGPLCRLDARFLPLLYNRRHLGVTTFLLGAAHSGFALFQFHALGDVNPFVSLFTSNRQFNSLANFPFQMLGFFALAILFLMAATSHDFWLRQLTAPVWKRMHMLVYLAYALLIAHVALGALQPERSPVLAVVLGLGMTVVLTLHLAAGWKERRIDLRKVRGVEEGFVDVCEAAAIPDQRAQVVSIGGERVAVFRYGDQVSAISNVCRHQNGPLGEGRIVDGCITCPWHGFQYRPEDGASPPPFPEKVATFHVRICNGRVLVDPKANPPGTFVKPARIENEKRQHGTQFANHG